MHHLKFYLKFYILLSHIIKDISPLVNKITYLISISKIVYYLYYNSFSDIHERCT